MLSVIIRTNCWRNTPWVWRNSSRGIKIGPVWSCGLSRMNRDRITKTRTCISSEHIIPYKFHIDNTQHANTTMTVYFIIIRVRISFYSSRIENCILSFFLCNFFLVYFISHYNFSPYILRVLWWNFAIQNTNYHFKLFDNN